MNEIRYVYCSACRREVRIASTGNPSVGDGHASIPDARNVCLDFGAPCEATGSEQGSADARCPVFRTSALAMGFDRARSGLVPDPQGGVVALCPACGTERSLEPVGTRHALCTICGSPRTLVPKEG